MREMEREQVFGLAGDPYRNIEIRDASTVCSDIRKKKDRPNPRHSLRQGRHRPPKRIPHMRAQKFITLV